MSLAEKIDKDTVAAMKAREPERLGTLRLMKTAIKNKEIDKRGPLSDAEVLQTLSTMIKQRQDSIEQFTKGQRLDLAEKERGEIRVIEEYLPKAAGADEIRGLVEQTVAEMAAGGQRPGPRDMGTVMKAVQARIQAAGLRADGRQVSEMVKSELAKG
jgi:uncharacterized protein YqeY